MTETRPLDAYLRGLNAVAPLERVMFLAEDRVFGNEIVLAQDKSWRIGYCPTAEATTDACDTFGELLRQRRRWQNSALAVRLWLWGRLPGLSRPPGQDLHRQSAVRRLDALAGAAHRLRGDEPGVPSPAHGRGGGGSHPCRKMPQRPPRSAARSSRPAASRG